MLHHSVNVRFLRESVENGAAIEHGHGNRGPIDSVIDAVDEQLQVHLGLIDVSQCHMESDIVRPRDIDNESLISHSTLKLLDDGHQLLI